MRSITLTGMQQMFAQQADHVLLVILEIDHSSLTNPVRLVNDTQNLSYGGNTYTALPFQFELPEDTDERPPEARLVLDNVNRDQVELLRDQTSPPTVQVDVVRFVPGDQAYHEFGPMTFQMGAPTFTASRISIPLQYEAGVLSEAAVQHVFNASVAPGLF